MQSLSPEAFGVGGDGDGGPTDPARQPLLSSPDVARSPSAPSPWCRCLLSLSNRNLMDICVICFMVHLFRHSQVLYFLHLLFVFLQADIFWPLAVVFSCASMVALYAYGVRGKKLTAGRCIFVFILAFSQIALVWFGLNQIGHLYQLPARCLVKKSWCGLSLFWLPSGLFQSSFDSLWRPWFLAFYALPLGLFGRGPLAETPWAQWRQAIMGTVFWFFTVFLLLAARSSAFQLAHPLDRRFLLMVGIAFGVIVLFWTFWLTSPPAVTYWFFLGNTWGQLLADVFRHHRFPRLAAEEYVVIFVTVWGFLRFAYLGALVRLARFAARKHMEEMLANALAHPFRAELEQNFAEGVAARMASFSVPQPEHDEEAGLPQPSRSVGGSLSEKHKALLAARSELLLIKAGHKSVLPRFLKITVRRKSVIEDTVAALKDRPVEELLAGKICVKYDREFGVDAGGLTRDWFDAVGRTLSSQAQQEPQKALFVAAPDQTLIPRSVARDYGEVSEKEQEDFRALLALGRFLALAVFHEQPLPASFSLILCKYLLRVPVGLDDVRRLDPVFYNGRVASILKADGLAQVNAALGEPLTFESAPNEACPKPEELKPGGSQILVTDANKKEYVQLLCEAYLCGGIRREIQCLLQGFWDVLPYEVLHQCDVRPSELALFLSGSSDLDPKEWQSASEGSPTEDQVVWFWQVVEEMTQEQRCLLLQFTTGSSRLPPGGWPSLKPRFTVKVTDAGSGSHLPHAHTCANQIVLYRYDSQDQLRSKLLHAILTEDFGFS